jgi:hypothetical protein
MSKLNQIKIPIVIEDNEFNWKLVRERDGLTKQSRYIEWLEFNEDGTFKEEFDEPAIGRSLLMSPFSPSFTWQTTTITEILEQQDDYIKFKTENSIYELFKL